MFSLVILTSYSLVLWQKGFFSNGPCFCWFSRIMHVHWHKLSCSSITVQRSHLKMAIFACKKMFTSLCRVLFMLNNETDFIKAKQSKHCKASTEHNLWAMEICQSIIRMYHQRKTTGKTEMFVDFNYFL